MESSIIEPQVFSANYIIGNGMHGAPSFQISLSINKSDEHISGAGHIFQAVNPPLNITTYLHGQYSYMTVMPNTTHILVTATGLPIQMHYWDPKWGIGPQIYPNVELKMALTNDWKSGTATYKYMDNSGNWKEVKDCPVKLNSTQTIQE